jgi:hypothetical protein
LQAFTDGNEEMIEHKPNNKVVSLTAEPTNRKKSIVIEDYKKTMESRTAIGSTTGNQVRVNSQIFQDAQSLTATHVEQPPKH